MDQEDYHLKLEKLEREWAASVHDVQESWHDVKDAPLQKKREMLDIYRIKVKAHWPKFDALKSHLEDAPPT